MSMPQATAGRIILEDGSVINGNTDPWQHVPADARAGHAMGHCDDCATLITARDRRLSALRVQLDPEPPERPARVR